MHIQKTVYANIYLDNYKGFLTCLINSGYINILSVKSTIICSRNQGQPTNFKVGGGPKLAKVGGPRLFPLLLQLQNFLLCKKVRRANPAPGDVGSGNLSIGRKSKFHHKTE